MVPGILIFGAAAFVLSLLIERRKRSFAGGELSLYFVLTAWGSMLAGILIAGR